MIPLHTYRLIVRRMTTEDSGFMLGLLNEPSWLRFIGDRGVRTVEAARRYIEDGPMEMYRRLGFGFYVVELKESGCPIGICGLAKRDFLDDVDIGYALLPQYCGQQYAYEAAHAVLSYARNELALKRVVATTRAENLRSSRLLERLGLEFDRVIRHPDGTRDLQLYAIDFT